MKNVFYLVFVFFTTQSCHTGLEAIDQAKASQELMEVSRQWANSASPEEFLSYWNDESILMEPGKPVVKGIKDITTALGQIMSTPGFGITWEPQEAFVSASGDIGYTIDRILVTYNDENNEQVKLFEKGVAVWHKQADGSWKNKIDIWNVDPSLTSIYK